jgi:hypothetical protein
MAHDAGLGCGDPREIEMAGDAEAARENWHFVGPFKKMTLPARMQHLIYWGPLRRPMEWSLKTVLAPCAYIASVLYHDSFWYPWNVERATRQVLAGPWGRLFHNWQHLTPDAHGFGDLGGEPASAPRAGARALAQSVGILGTCIKEAPEFASHRRRARQPSHNVA